MRMVKVKMPTVYIDWAEVFRKFLAQGEEVMELTEFGDRTFMSVYSGAQQAVISNRFDDVIKVSMRKGHIYLIRKEKEEQ